MAEPEQPPEEEHPPGTLSRLAGAAPEAVGGVGGALVGYTLGGIEGTILGPLATPALVATVRLGLTALIPRWQRGSQVVGAAAAELHVDLDELAARANADPQRLELLARVLEAAGRTTVEEKIPALGRVLAAGLSNGGNVEEARLLANALDVIEAPHVQLLAAIHGQPPHPAQPDWLVNTGKSPHGILEKLPGHRPMFEPLVHMLEGQGLVKNIGEAGGQVPNPDDARFGHDGVSTQSGRRSAEPRWQVTVLGKRCLQLLGHLRGEG